jgi:antitoxin YefM
MTIVSYTNLRHDLATYMEQACNAMEPIHVTRQGARGVVMMSEDEYESLMETVHLLRSPHNAARLLNSIADAEAGKLIEQEI